MSYADVVLQDGPNLYWPLGDYGVTDVSGHGRTGTLLDSPSMVATKLLALEPGHAMSTPGGGTPAGVTLAYDSGLDVGTGDFTIEGWVAYSLAGDNYVTFLSRDDPAVGNGQTLYLTGSGASPVSVMRFWCGGTVMNGTVSINDGVGRHLVVCRASGTLAFYVNGTLDVSATAAGSTDTSSSIRLGATSGGTNAQYDNAFTAQHVAYYKKALSSTRITAHYVEGALRGGVSFYGGIGM